MADAADDDSSSSSDSSSSTTANCLKNDGVPGDAEPSVGPGDAEPGPPLTVVAAKAADQFLALPPPPPLA